MKVSKRTVSIIVARKEGEDSLAALQSSLDAQTCQDFEILIAEPPASLAVARNQAAAKAQGEYLAFVNSDHLWLPNKLEKQLSALNANQGLRWCYCDAVLAGSQSRSSEINSLHAGDILRPLLLKNFIPSGAVVLSRQVFESLGGFSEADIYRSSEEWEFWIRLAAVHPAGLIDQPLVQVPHEIFVTAQQQISRKRVVESAVALHQNRLKDLRSESLAEICMAAGNAHLKANERNEARRNFEEALTHSPLRSDAYLSWVSSFLSSEAQRQIKDLHNLSRHLQRAEKGQATEKTLGS